MGKRVAKSSKANGRKPRAKKSATKTPKLIPQSNGRGALLAGGMPGNRGGSGRPPDVIRKRCRDSFDKRIPILERIADDKLGKDSDQPRVRDRIMALSELSRVGLGAGTQIAAAQVESPEGYTFTLVLGERGQS